MVRLIGQRPTSLFNLSSLCDSHSLNTHAAGGLSSKVQSSSSGVSLSARGRTCPGNTGLLLWESPQSCSARKQLREPQRWFLVQPGFMLTNNAGTKTYCLGNALQYHIIQVSVPLKQYIFITRRWLLAEHIPLPTLCKCENMAVPQLGYSPNFVHVLT